VQWRTSQELNKGKDLVTPHLIAATRPSNSLAIISSVGIRLREPQHGRWNAPQAAADFFAAALTW
jgi:hypothetical protein